MCKKGDVYWAELPVLENSQIQAGWRPVVITSNKFAAEHSQVVQYMPLTTKIKRTDLPVHVVINPDFLPHESMVLAEQEGLIDKHRLKEKIGTLSEDDILRIDMAKIIQGGIDIVTIINRKRMLKQCR